MTSNVNLRKVSLCTDPQCHKTSDSDTHGRHLLYSDYTVAELLATADDILTGPTSAFSKYARNEKVRSLRINRNLLIANCVLWSAYFLIMILK